VLKGEKKQEW